MTMSARQERLDHISRDVMRLLDSSDPPVDREVLEAGLTDVLYQSAFEGPYRNEREFMGFGLELLEGVEYLQWNVKGPGLSGEWSDLGRIMMGVFERASKRFDLTIGVRYQVSGCWVDGGHVRASLYFEELDLQIPFLEFDDFIFGDVEATVTDIYYLDVESVKEL